MQILHPYRSIRKRTDVNDETFTRCKDIINDMIVISNDPIWPANERAFILGELKDLKNEIDRTILIYE